MKIWKVDDGQWHWVIATSAEDALAVWHEEMGRLGIPDADLDLDEPPRVDEVPLEKAASVTVWEDHPGNVVGTMLGEYEADASRRYLGGSEW